MGDTVEVYLGEGPDAYSSTILLSAIGASGHVEIHGVEVLTSLA